MSDLATSPLLDWVLRQHPETSKSQAKKWILSGRVSVNGIVLRKPQERLADPGDTLKLHDRHVANLACGSGWQIQTHVMLLYLDAAFAIVNKAAGLMSVSTPNCPFSAFSILADFLLGKLRPHDHRGADRSLPPAYRRLEPWPVHRLDQNTSGLFCIATNPVARQHLIEQLKTHTMRREYVAFVDGRAPAPQGTWQHWLQLSHNRMRQHVVSAKQAGSLAEEAITHYEVITEYPLANDQGCVTQLRLRLETGRKHQIRVQAAHVGLPLIGDSTYHPAYRAQDSRMPIDFARQALHAEVLSLEHPDQPGTRMTWTAEWPKDLRQLERVLRSARR